MLTIYGRKRHKELNCSARNWEHGTNGSTLKLKFHNFFLKTRFQFLLLATILLKFATRRHCFTCYRKEHISTQLTQKGLNYSACDSELGTIAFLFNNEGPFCSVSTGARFNVIVGNAFLGTVVPKPSIKDQFALLEIHNSEQFFFSLTIKEGPLCSVSL